MRIVLCLCLIVLCICHVIQSASTDKYQYAPVVFWHGMGDTSDGSLTGLRHMIEAHLNHSVYTYSIRIGKDQEADFFNSYFKDCNTQVAWACEQIKQDPQLVNGFTIIGFSQGGQFARALIQRCELSGPITLITIGGQHQGVFGLPKCTDALCNYVSRLIDIGAYETHIQNHLVQAQYWHDPIEHDKYVQRSIFLADINNEREPRNTLYQSRIKALKRFVMVQFDNDTIVIPRESSLFGFYKQGQDKVITSLEDSDLYVQDWLGLKHLATENRLIQLHTPGDHLQIDHDWFVQQIVKPYLMNMNESM